MSFDFSEMYVGCPVIVSRDPTQSDKTIGYVTKVKNDCVDVIAQYGGWNGGFRPYADCLHLTDPRCTERPALFEDDLRGVFELAPQELARRETLKRLQSCEQVIKAMADKLSELESKVSAISKATARGATTKKSA